MTEKFDKNFERKEENSVNQQFSFFDLPKISSFGKGRKIIRKEEITCHVQFYPFPQVYQACHVKSWLHF